MKAMATETAEKVGNLDDAEYGGFLRRFRGEFQERAPAPLFTTDATELWKRYLKSFPPSKRQYHTCNACKSFIERFGGLVTIDEFGRAEPAFWDPATADKEHEKAFRALRETVAAAKVTGVFLTSERSWGHPITGQWMHLHAEPLSMHLWNGVVQNASQAMAEKKQDRDTLARAIFEYSMETVAKALSVLNSDALYRGEKVRGPVEFLGNLHDAMAKNKGHRANLLWRAVATAPPGFCHPRSTMVGTLLEDLRAGMNFDQVERRFRDKMDPGQYQRPQAAPTSGNIDQAERIVFQMGIERSLERRYARVDELTAFWRRIPTDMRARGVFGSLRPSQQFAAVNPQPMTMTKFRRVVLPNATSIELNVPYRASFAAICTALYLDAPPILQWDSAIRRNPFSWYTYRSQTLAHQWGLRVGWCQVRAITEMPWNWTYTDFKRFGEGVLFVLDGARDTRSDMGNALFPEILKSELHSVRATIEAFSRRSQLHGRQEASACGLALEKTGHVELRVTDSSNNVTSFIVDRTE